MVYANIVVNHATARSSSLSYLITPEQFLKLKSGMLVEVPFRLELIEGVVLNLSKATNAPKSKLKPIKRVLSCEPIILPYQIELAKWMAHYYGVSLGEALFTMIPHLSRRML